MKRFLRFLIRVSGITPLTSPSLKKFDAAVRNKDTQMAIILGKSIILQELQAKRVNPLVIKDLDLATCTLYNATINPKNSDRLGFKKIVDSIIIGLSNIRKSKEVYTPNTDHVLKRFRSRTFLKGSLPRNLR